MSQPISPHGVEQSLADCTTLVAGGTGNVGRHVVRALLERGATVVVPSRSPARLDALHAAVGPAADRLVAPGIGAAPHVGRLCFRRCGFGRR